VYVGDRQGVTEQDNRAEGRANVFLAAALDTGEQLYPVRIRNLSQHGALVDGLVLPPAGSGIRLMRGHLSASGRIAWQLNGQAGVNLHDQIDVESWVRRVGHSGQQRVDAMVDALRRPGSVPSDSQPGAAIPPLRELSAALDAVCEHLANAAGFSVAMSDDLLKLDAIAQHLRQLATGSKT
jgi:hypothetical protein